MQAKNFRDALLSWGSLCSSSLSFPRENKWNESGLRLFVFEEKELWGPPTLSWIWLLFLFLWYFSILYPFPRAFLPSLVARANRNKRVQKLSLQLVPFAFWRASNYVAFNIWRISCVWIGGYLSFSLIFFLLFHLFSLFGVNWFAFFQRRASVGLYWRFYWRLPDAYFL